jgi:hypothetical protein
MRPIRAIPSSAAPSDRTGGTPAQTEQRSYGSVPPHCESCPRPTARGRAWALASESPPVALAPGWDHCRTPHRPAPAASPEDQGRGWGILPQAVVPPEPGARPPFDTHHSHWLRSLRPPTAWLAHHRLSAAPSRICRDPRGWAPFVRPFFCWFLGAIQQHLLPIDPLQGFVTLGQLSPYGPKGIQFQPDLEPPLHCFVRRKPGGQHPPPNPCDQDGEHGAQTRPVVIRGTSVPTPHHRGENRRKERPHVLGYLPGKVSQLRGNTSWRQRSDRPTIKFQRGFVP